MRKLFLMIVAATLIASCGGRNEKVNDVTSASDYEVNVQTDDGEYEDVVELTISGLELTHEVNVVEHFEGIKASGAWHVIMSDSVQRPTIVADEILMPYLKVKVKDNKLVASYSKSIHYRGKVSEVPILKVPLMANLKSLELSGASKFENRVPMQGDSLEVEIAGASKADIDATKIAKYIEMDVAGASKVMLNCDVENLDIEVAGASKLDLKGKAQRLDLETAGACKIGGEKVNNRFVFEADVANIEMAGASKVELHCNDQLNVEAAGAGSVKYSGNPRISQDAAGIVSVKKVR